MISIGVQNSGSTEIESIHVKGINYLQEESRNVIKLVWSWQKYRYQWLHWMAITLLSIPCWDDQICWI